jgi:RNA polymerase sigma factor (sigma-70 family)
MIVAPVAARPVSERTLNVEPMEGHANLTHLIERDLDRAYRLAGLLLGDGAAAEEAVGDALEAAFRHERELRDPARFGAWFDRILVNRCRDELRRRTRVRLIALVGDPIAGRDPFGEVIARDEALRALAGLPPDERVVVVLHFWADLTLNEVATRTGLPVGTVKSRLHRALERFRGAGTMTPGGPDADG